jgi:glutamate transport system substrate-binding protein
MPSSNVDISVTNRVRLWPGQSVLVCADNNDITGTPSLQNNKRLCSVTGSTPAQRIDAVTTDETIGAGYAAQVLGVFNIVERYG